MRRAATTAGLGVALALSLTLAGCLFPMPIEEEPLEANDAPTFQVGQVAPAYSRVITYDPEISGRTLTFSVGAIDDPNLDDRFFYRWFLNYRGQLEKRVFEEGPPSGRPPETRAQGIEFSLDPCLYLRSSGLHQIDLLVADRPFVAAEDEDPDEQTPNQVLPEDAGYFRITWFLQHVDPAKCDL